MNQTPEAERALFEAHAEKIDLDMRKFEAGDIGAPPGTYVYPDTQAAWLTWQAARAIPQAAAEPVWQKLHYDSNINFGKLIDVVLSNGVTEYARRCNQVDWTQVEDWRYASPDRAPSIDSAPTGNAVLDKQVADWRKEVARLNDLISTATAPSTDSATERDALTLAAEYRLRIDFNYLTSIGERPGVAVWGPNDCHPYPPYWSGDRRDIAKQAVDTIGRAIAAMKGEG